MSFTVFILFILLLIFFFFFFNDTATTEIYTLSLHDALPIRSSSWSGSHAAASAGSSARRSFQSHAYDLSRACIRPQPSCPAASARLQQFARTPGDRALTYPKATSALRRCASTLPRTPLTWASTRAAHAATSSILACAAVSSLLTTWCAIRFGASSL